jgi:hypothetical protein
LPVVVEEAPLEAVITLAAAPEALAAGAVGVASPQAVNTREVTKTSATKINSARKRVDIFSKFLSFLSLVLRAIKTSLKQHPAEVKNSSKL